MILSGKLFGASGHIVIFEQHDNSENREPEYDPIESDSPNPASRSVNPDPPLVAS